MKMMMDLLIIVMAVVATMGVRTIK